MRRGEISKAILAEIDSEVEPRTSTEVAMIVGCRPEYVRVVARRNGIRFGYGRPGGISSVRQISTKNWDWLKSEADALGVSVVELMDAIVTDARLDD